MFGYKEHVVCHIQIRGMGETIHVSKEKECNSEHLMDVVFEEEVTVENNQSFQT